VRRHRPRRQVASSPYSTENHTSTRECEYQNMDEIESGHTYAYEGCEGLGYLQNESGSANDECREL